MVAIDFALHAISLGAASTAAVRAVFFLGLSIDPEKTSVEAANLSTTAMVGGQDLYNAIAAVNAAQIIAGTPASDDQLERTALSVLSAARKLIEFAQRSIEQARSAMVATSDNTARVETARTDLQLAETLLQHFRARYPVGI
jgi:hypothetical protein